MSYHILEFILFIFQKLLLKENKIKISLDKFFRILHPK